MRLRSISLCFPATVLALALPAAHPAAAQEFNWIPSGAIEIGDAKSEAAAHYEACGPAASLESAYRGENARKITGRLVSGPETFILRPASYRGGPAPAHLVLSRRMDSADGPREFVVRLGDQDLGSWHIAPPPGERRLYDAFFVIPKSAFLKKNEAPDELRVTLTLAKQPPGPVHALGYRFYATRDWDILGENLAGDVAARSSQADDGPSRAYLAGLLAEADHDHDRALSHYTTAAAGPPELARLARVAQRRMHLRLARAAALHADRQTNSDPAALAGSTLEQRTAVFDRHYRLGLLAGAWGCWEDALAELRLATQFNAAHPDATYRLAEAMEYNRLPIDQWAPLFERAGLLFESQRVARGLGPANKEDVLIAVHLPAAQERDPATGEIRPLCGVFSQDSLEQLQRDWRYVEQQVYAASRGAWELRTHWHFYTPEMLAQTPWVMQAGWIFQPPDRALPPRMFDYSIGTAEFGSSHAGGVDCGVAGAGGAQIGPTRGWEVWLHEWNHQFDWVGLFGETAPGYPPTHDSDGCGKQPIVSMGCGHRSSMRYYMNAGQYLRHEASDPVVPAAMLREWSLGEVVAPPQAPNTSAEELAAWLVEQKHFTPPQLDGIKREWEAARKEETQRKQHPPLIPSEPMPGGVPEWFGFLEERWHLVKHLDRLTSRHETEYVRGQPAGGKTLSLPPDKDFINLNQHAAGSPHKCVGYARTFIWSPRTQQVRLWLGHNDYAALWLNGRKIHRGEYFAQAKWRDREYPAMLAKAGVLQEGWNCLATKVERCGGNWGFSVHLVDFENRPVEGLKFAAELPAGEKPNLYVPPPVGKHYRWADVQDDYLELLPRLAVEDLRQITGIEGLELAEHRFFLKLPAEHTPKGSRAIAKPDDKDTELNNYLNWDREAAAALRIADPPLQRDLLLIRPEYYDEFLHLLLESSIQEQVHDSTWSPHPADRLLGYLFLPECDYASTPGRSGRAVLVVDACLPDEYPLEDLDLLQPPPELPRTARFTNQ